MNRRNFIKISSSLSLLPFLVSSCVKKDENINFDISLSSDMEAGHLIFSSESWDSIYIKELDYLIVGGGIAGLSAAKKLENEDFILFELGSKIGGSSSSEKYQSTLFSQGAHYDWSYPATYGKEVLHFFEKLDIIEFDKTNHLWNFRDKEFVIEGPKSQSYVKEDFHKEYLEGFEDFEAFYSIITPYLGEMHLPTRLIRNDFQELNNISFQEFLEKNGLFAHQDFLQTLSYQLIDDYGAGVASISALAGIHYYICRPYYSKKMELFSPPQGNSYFTEKLKEGISSKIRTNHVVKKIVPKGSSFLVDVININTKTINQYLCKNIIYAGQKHALKYILPEQHTLFARNTYSPWVVVNIILKEPIKTDGVWQNEFPLNTENFMGFIDSNSQKKQGKHVLSCYYCFPPEERNHLSEIKENLNNFTQNTISNLNKYFDQDISLLIEKVFIKVMGHAMPIPTKGYLLDDKNKKRLYPNLTFAGVDNGRLPLLFEAVDSGIMAVEELKNNEYRSKF